MTTITLDQPAPKYGDHITFSVHAEVPQTGVHVTFTHAAGRSVSSVEYHTAAGDYSKSVGCYAPNWPPSPAHGVADVLQVVSSKGGRIKTIVVASVEFEVTA